MSLLFLSRRRGAAPGGGGGGGGSGTAVTVTADVWRWDGNTGSVRVMTGWPLKPGLLTSSDVSQVRVFDDTGTEVAVAVTPIDGAPFADGSLRAVGLQFVASLTNNVSKTYTVKINQGTRTTSDLTWQDPWYDPSAAAAGVATPALRAGMTNRATMVPAESQYWCDTFVALTPLKPIASEVDDTAKSFYSPTTDAGINLKYMADWMLSTNYGVTRGAGATYEHAHGFLCLAIRASSGTVRRTFYQAFWDTVAAQITSAADGHRFVNNDNPPTVTIWQAICSHDPSLVASTGGGNYDDPEPHMGSFYYGYACAHFMTGWRQPMRVISWLNGMRYPGNTYGDSVRNAWVKNSPDGTPRVNARNLWPTAMLAYVTGATINVNNWPFQQYGRNNDVASWANDLTWVIDAALEFAYPNDYALTYMRGLVTGMRSTVDLDGGAELAAGQFPTFQIHLAAATLIFYYQNVKNDSRIPTAVVKMADFVKDQMLATGPHTAIPYIASTPPMTTGSIWSTEQWLYAPMFAELFGFAYAHTGDTAYKTALQRCATPDALCVDGPYNHLTNSFVGQDRTTKAFGEHFAGKQQSAKFYLDGGSTRPVTNAHPTTIVTLPTRTS